MDNEQLSKIIEEEKDALSGCRSMPQVAKIGRPW